MLGSGLKGDLITLMGEHPSSIIRSTYPPASLTSQRLITFYFYKRGMK